MSKMRFASHYDKSCYLIFLDVGYDNLDGKPLIKENLLKNISFNKFIFKESTNNNIIFIFAFVEFGCELLIPHYLLPQICNDNPDKKIIVLGWHGRHFLYSHLVDEFWEIKEEHMWLKDTVRAMHHHSKNIRKLEMLFSEIGYVIPSFRLGNLLMQSECSSCGKKFGSKSKKNICPRCHESNISHSYFADPISARKKYCALASISAEAKNWAAQVARPNMVGIFARNRKAYGRNLSFAFYKQLVCDLLKKGFTPIWLGEKCSVHDCPEGAIDFSSIEEARNLENIIALVSMCSFTIQLWTASTRISFEAKCPFLLVESPDQLYGAGQEGIRLDLLDINNLPKKIILSNYKKAVENIETFNSIIMSGIDQLLSKNYDHLIGLVDDHDFVSNLIEKYKNDKL